MRKIIFRLFFILGIFYFSIGAQSFAQENLPKIITEAPTQKFEELGPVSATERTVDEARIELTRQAKKLGAQAIILKNCEAGSIKRDGLTWNKHQASCEGMAIRFKK